MHRIRDTGLFPERTAGPAARDTGPFPAVHADRIPGARLPAEHAPAVTATRVADQPAADSPRRKALRLGLILVASFMMVLDFSIVNVALPSIERELHLSPSVVDWVVTAYAIAFGGLLILGGRAADMLGRRRMFVIGLVAFSLASLSGGLARDPVLLLSFRVV